MSNLTVRGNPLGTGTFTVESPNSNNSRTITLPDATTTLVGTDTTQTLTNKTINGGALTLMTAQASTSGTSIDFTGIPSWVKRVTVMFDGVSTNGTSLPLVQLGDSGGVETTGYTASSGNIFGTTVASTSSTAGFVINSNLAATTLQGSLVFTNISGNSWTCHGVVGNTVGTVQTILTAGVKTLSATLDRIRITTVNGTDTFDAGTINVLYEG